MEITVTSNVDTWRVAVNAIRSYRDTIARIIQTVEEQHGLDDVTRHLRMECETADIARSTITREVFSSTGTLL